MQGYFGQSDKIVTLRNILKSNEYDVVCIQEAGDVLGSFSDEVYFEDDILVYGYPEPALLNLRKNPLSNYYAAVHYWGRQNYRCSMVVYVKKYLTYSFFALYFEKCGLRPAVCVKYNDVIVANVHFVSGNPMFAKNQLIELIWKLNGKKFPYYIVGDFNINALSPNDKNDLSRELNGHLSGFTGRIISPIAKTQASGGCLDHMFAVPSPLNGRFYTDIISPPGYWSDHAIIKYFI